jgi:glycosyltransferase involved in cell wall biosynthesis
MTSERPLHVVAHNASSVLGGGEIGTALLLAGLRRRGHRVLMLCRNRRVAAGVAGYGVPTAVLPVRGDAMLADALRLAARLRRERPDALVLTTFRRIFLAALGAQLGGAPFVVQRIVLEGDTPARGLRYRLALRRWIDAVVLNADAMRAPVLAGDARLAPERVLTIPDGVAVPVRRAPEGAVRRELGIDPGARVVGSIGRLASQKRYDRLVRAVATQGARTHLLLAGEGPELESLRGLAAELGIEDRVHLVGFRDDVGDVLAAMDVFAISSDREGMANAMLEAMRAGVPVVSTSVSGADEALGGGAGVVVERAAPALADAIGVLLADPALRERVGQAGSARAGARFGDGRFIDDWERLLVEGRRRRAPR